MKLYRIYTCLDDFGGWHTAIYYDEKSASDYFKKVRAKHPEDLVITEVLDDDTGDVLQRKMFGNGHGLTVDEVKSMRQEYVSLVRHSLKYYEDVVVEESISPEAASKEMIAAVDMNGFGTEWIYTIKHCPFVDHIEGVWEIPESLKMKI